MCREDTCPSFTLKGSIDSAVAFNAEEKVRKPSLNLAPTPSMGQ